MKRLEDLKRFYKLLDTLKQRNGGTLLLKDCHGKTKLPTHGVYFFFEEGEQRTDSGEGLRVVRVGTHALTEKSKATLWNRLSWHRGIVKTEGGNHRGSVFRKLVGKALLKKQQNMSCPNWGVGNSAKPEIREAEHFMEKIVSIEIGKMPFLCLPVNDRTLRKFIEQNCIALLSDYQKEGVACFDSASRNWLGHHSDCEKVRGSGLWNSDHVGAEYTSEFLEVFEQLIYQI